MPEMFFPDFVCDLTMENTPTAAWLESKTKFDRHNAKLRELRPDCASAPEWVLVLIGSMRCSYWDGTTGTEGTRGWCYSESQALKMTKTDACAMMGLERNAWAWRCMMLARIDPDKFCFWLPTVNGWVL